MKNNLRFKIVLDREPSHRHKDDNGFLIVRDNPIALSGVYDYLAYEIDEALDGKPEGDEIKKVFRPFKDLEAKKDFFARKPIQLTHIWTGANGEKQDAAGVIGEIITAKNGGLYADLTIFSADLIDKIEKGEIVELSPGYDCEFIAESGSADGEHYDFKQILKNVNHLAVVENGRAGHDLRIQDNKPNKGENLKKSILDGVIAALKKARDEEPKTDETKDACETKDAGELEEAIKAIIESDEIGVDEKAAKIAEMLSPKATDEDETEAKDEDEPKAEDEDETETKDDEGEEIAIKEGEVEELKEALTEAIEEAVERKVGDAMKAFRANQKAVSDAIAEVRGVVGNFDSSSVISASDAYKIGYEALSGEKLSKAMDAKTAFSMAKKAIRPQMRAKDEASVKSGVSSLISRFK